GACRLIAATAWARLRLRGQRRHVICGCGAFNSTFYSCGGYTMAKEAKETKLTRTKLIDLLNEDLEREYQAIIAYVVYSQVLKGAEYMNIADELEVHAGEELQHAITLANQIDYLGGMPKTTPKPVKTSE